MSASIAGFKVIVSDLGTGVQPEVQFSINLGQTGGSVDYRLVGATQCNLTPTQMTTLQNAITTIKDRALVNAKTDFNIP